tara:strand:+ start:9 stop:4031 length:4023 start_codon:yes stop_codon:yes gene_type:complete
MSVRSRVFGSNIDTKVRSILEARQIVQHDYNMDFNFSSPTDQIKTSFGPSIDSQTEQSEFKNVMNYISQNPYFSGPMNSRIAGSAFDDFGTQELSTRTPFVRMWTAVQVYKPEEVTTNYKQSDLLTGYRINENKQEDVNGNVNTLPNESITVQDEAFLESIKGKNENATDVTKYHTGIVKVTEKIAELQQYETAIYEVGNHNLSQDRLDNAAPFATGIRGTNAFLSEKSNLSIPLVSNQQLDIKTALGNSVGEDFDVSDILPMEFETNHNEFLKPPAGITSVNSTTEGPLGARKRTTVNFIVHNWHDYENIFSRFFLRPAAQIYVDIGWSSSILYSPYQVIGSGDSFQSDKVLAGILSESPGTLETVIGHVTNYDAKVRKDGSVQCMLEIVSRNTAVLANDISNSTKAMVKASLEAEFIQFAATHFNGPISEWIATADWHKSIETKEEWEEVFNLYAPNYLHGKYQVATEVEWLIPSAVNKETGVMWGGIDYREKLGKSEKKDLYISWGLFEDKVLNTQFGHGGRLEEFIQGSIRGAGFDSSLSFVRWDENLFRRQIYTEALGEVHWPFLLPDNWDSNLTSRSGTVPDINDTNKWENLTFAHGSTYNAKRFKTPAKWRIAEMGLQSSPQEFPDGTSAENIFSDLDNNSGIPGLDIGKEAKFAEWTTNESETKWDKARNRIPLREIFISLNLIKEALDASENVTELIRHILKRLSESSENIWDLEIYHNGKDNVISIIDKNLPIIDIGGEISDIERIKPFEFHPTSPESLIKDYDVSLQMPQGQIGSWVAVSSMSPNSQMNIFDSVIDAAVMNRIIDNYSDSYKNKLRQIGIRYLPTIGSYASHRLNHQDSEASGFDLNFRKNDEDIFGQLIQPGENIDFDDGSLYSNDGLKDVMHSVEKSEDSKYKDKTRGRGLEDDDLIEAHAVYARTQGYIVANSVSDYYIQKAKMTQVTEKIPTILPIKCSLSIHGISGIIPGDCFRVDTIPAKHRKYTYFQTVRVTHDISNTWTTIIEGVMRVRTTKKRNAVASGDSIFKPKGVILNKKCLIFENSPRFGITKGLMRHNEKSSTYDAPPSFSQDDLETPDEYGTRQGFLNMIRNVEPFIHNWAPGTFKFITAIYKFKVNDYGNPRIPWKVHIPKYIGSDVPGLNKIAIEKLNAIGASRFLTGLKAAGQPYGYGSKDVMDYYAGKLSNRQYSNMFWQSDNYINPFTNSKGQSDGSQGKEANWYLYPNEEWLLIVNGGSPNNPWTIWPYKNITYRGNVSPMLLQDNMIKDFADRWVGNPIALKDLSDIDYRSRLGNITAYNKFKKVINDYIAPSSELELPEWESMKAPRTRGSHALWG